MRRNNWTGWITRLLNHFHRKEVFWARVEFRFESRNVVSRVRVERWAGVISPTHSPDTNGDHRTFRSACRKSYYFLPPTDSWFESFGFVALVEAAICAGKGKRRAANLFLEDFRHVRCKFELEAEKFFSMLNFYTKGQLRLKSQLPILKEARFNFISSIIYFYGISVLVGKRFSVRELWFFWEHYINFISYSV